MASQEDNTDQRVVAIVVIGAVLLSIGLAVGMGISKSRLGSANSRAAVTAANPGTALTYVPATVGPASAMADNNDARVLVENGILTFYFAPGQAALANGADAALADSIAAVQAGKRLVISGFHDMTGDPALNAELAKLRAMAVRDSLVRAGVPDSSMELVKPIESTGPGSNAQARRVEVVIAQ